ncbi:peptide deformylase [Persephonella sp.]
MSYHLRTWPDKILKKKMDKVDFFSDEKLKEYIDVMFKKMYELEGVGLAANQIGIPYQIIVIDTTNREESEEEGKKLVLINPEIIEKDGEVLSTEGCLSFPGVQIEIPRAEKVKVKAFDFDGNEINIETDGFLAIVLQHEIDHINGIPFINYLPPVKKRLVLEKYMKNRKKDKDTAKAKGV